MTEKSANTPCRRIYLVIQLMYIDRKNIKPYHNNYWQLVRELIGAAPSMLNLIDAISRKILADQYYKALKLTQNLIDYEQDVLKSV